MNLPDLQRHWDTFGRQDPFWAILTDPTRRGNRWTPDEFFETGRVEVAELLKRAEQLGVPRRWRRALDFGCGAGRLTQALADRFETAVGVDVAPSMIALAREHNRHGGGCVYEVNDRPDLARWSDGSFDLVYTSRVLQHIAPEYSRAYIREFVRVLAPDGYLSFDVPSGSGDAAALADGTIPASMMQAALEVVATDERAAISPGDPVRFRVIVRNCSEATWVASAAHAINVGNHWLRADGTLHAMDDARQALPTSFGPGQRTEVNLTVTAPDVPGTYRLQFDVVQEGVAWFATCGSTPAEVLIRVEASGSRAQDAQAASQPVPSPGEGEGAFEPVMEMHAVPREEVEAILADAGARLLDIGRVHHCGPQWLAFRYDVTR